MDNIYNKHTFYIHKKEDIYRKITFPIHANDYMYIFSSFSIYMNSVYRKRAKYGYVHENVDLCTDDNKRVHESAVSCT